MTSYGLVAAAHSIGFDRAQVAPMNGTLQANASFRQPAASMEILTGTSASVQTNHGASFGRVR
jgi:hypothetical protein